MKSSFIDYAEDMLALVSVQGLAIADIDSLVHIAGTTVVIMITLYRLISDIRAKERNNGK